MADIFQRTLKKAIDTRSVSGKAADATNWLRQTASKATSRHVSPTRIISQKQMQTRAKGGITIGQMYLFAYDPKHKKTLPYYDRFPLIFPFDYADGGFYGINLHYLSPQHRAQLMDALYGLLNNLDRDETTQLRLSYQILKSSSKFKYFAPCVKHYLNSHVQSPFYYINPDEWDAALFLPLQRFEKASSSKVYVDSINKVR